KRRRPLPSARPWGAGATRASWRARRSCWRAKPAVTSPAPAWWWTGARSVIRSDRGGGWQTSPSARREIRAQSRDSRTTPRRLQPAVDTCRRTERKSRALWIAVDDPDFQDAELGVERQLFLGFLSGTADLDGDFGPPFKMRPVVD